MTARMLSERELKLTAALYAKHAPTLDHVKATGDLPPSIPTGGRDIGMRLLIRDRSIDIELTSDEQLVFEAILRSRRLPGGSVILIDEELKRRGEA